MIALYLTLAIPALGVLIMILCGAWRFAGIINTLFSAAALIASIFLALHIIDFGPLLSPQQQFYIDAFNLISIVLTTFIATTTAWFSYKLPIKATGNRLRLYHSMYQAFLLTMLITLTTNNIGTLWIAMEGATLATVLLVSLNRTPQAIEAAWKYFILCIVGIALALFGTILVYASAAKIFSTSNPAILWRNLLAHAALLNPQIIKLAFVFLLVGYGTKIGLVPLHNWLPDAHSESPAPMSALLSGLLLNVALYAVVRFKMLADVTLGNNLAGYLMMGFGLFSFVFAALIIYRQQNLKRLFSYSSIEHMGLITFAFGIGTLPATFCALFYMLMHSLTKSAIFATAGNVLKLTGTAKLEQIRGLLKRQPSIGWGLLIATIAICGFPPFGIFTSEFMLLLATINAFPILALVLVLGFIFALAGIMHNIQPIVFGDPHETSTIKANMLAPILHLLLVLVLGIYLPPTLAKLLNSAATLIAGKL